MLSFEPRNADTNGVVIVQDRRQMIREGLVHLLSGAGIRVFGAAVDPDEVPALAAGQPVHAVLVQFDHGTAEDPIIRLSLAMPGLRLVAHGTSPTPMLRASAARLGITDVVDHEHGLAGVVSVLRGQEILPSCPLAPVPAGPGSVVTKREVEVLQLIATGITGREIAFELGISAKTVENHKQRIFAKLGVQNQAHAISVAIRLGVFRPHERARSEVLASIA